MEPILDMAAMQEAVRNVLPDTQKGNTCAAVIDGYSVMATLISGGVAICVYRKIRIPDTYDAYWQLNQLNSCLGTGKGTYTLHNQADRTFLFRYFARIDHVETDLLEQQIFDAVKKAKSGLKYLTKGT